MLKKWVAMLCILIVFCTGCMDVESYLQPPGAQGQQRAVQQALEEALKSEGYAASYILKYPVGGDISSAFLLLDENGAQTDADKAVMAVALYAPAAGQHTHIRLLHCGENGWYTVNDIKGQAKDLHKVALGDLDGDGKQELLVGWQLYSSDYQLSVYTLSGRLQETADVGRYTAYTVGDLSEHAGDEVLLLHIADTASATLCKWTPDTTKTLGTAPLRADMRTFEKMLLGKISTGDTGLYVDTVLENGKSATTLIYWDGNGLQVPLYRTGAASSRLADRAAGFRTKDIDDNGVPEIPVTVPLNGVNVEIAQSWQWLTEWYTWDVTAGAAVRQSAGIVNSDDGYYIELDVAWLSTLSTRYDVTTCTLWLESVDGKGQKQPFLAIQHTDGAKQSSDDTYDFEELPGELPLRIWYETGAPYRLTMEKVSYMLVQW